MTVTIIGILAAMSFGALQMAREAARETATKSTIAKLNNVVMRRYESYATRRVPIRIPPGMLPRLAAEIRLAAIRDLMRMEMPERYNDIISDPTPLPYLPIGSNQLPEPALHRLYRDRYNNTPQNPDPTKSPAHAECLYMLISIGSPEAMEQFNQSEIADTDGYGGPEFVDGWGKPIYFLRWAPGCSLYSDIQPAEPINSHDPFDTRNVDSAGYKLIPLIFSFGRDGVANVNVGHRVNFFDSTTSLAPTSICGFGLYQNNGAPEPAGSTGAFGNITNHHIEQR
ncbi:MAG: hypothetical protein KKA28_03600 [Planctomycetes bacterium]|nr:hypothetical protein [Planctomycetota bacterium]MCG2682485.1 hypothetical protein [Planctomycetales bacterium]